MSILEIPTILFLTKKSSKLSLFLQLLEIGELSRMTRPELNESLLSLSSSLVPVFPM